MRAARGAQGAGKRNRRVSILEKQTIRSGGGQLIVSWVTRWRPMAWVIVMGGLETIRAGAEVAITQASVRIPYKPGVTALMRVKVGSTHYEITEVIHDEGGRQHTDLVCKAVTGAA